MKIKRKFKEQLEYIEEPMHEMAFKLVEKPSFHSFQISDLFGRDFLRTAEEKLTESELDTVQNFIDVFVNLVKI